MPLIQDVSVNAIPRNDKSADRSRRTIRVTGPASYPTGGSTILPVTEIGFGTLHMLNGAVARSHGDAGLTCRLVALNRDSATNPKLQWYDMAGAEIANGVDLSAYEVYLEFSGQ